MAKLEVLEESDGLCHTYVPIHFEAHIGNRVSWVDIPNCILSDDVQTWSLLWSSAADIYISLHKTKTKMVEICKQVSKTYLICDSGDDSNGKSENNGDGTS